MSHGANHESPGVFGRRSLQRVRTREHAGMFARRRYELLRIGRSIRLTQRDIQVNRVVWCVCVGRRMPCSRAGALTRQMCVCLCVCFGVGSDTGVQKFNFSCVWWS